MLIIDYEVGNLRNLQKLIESLGREVNISNSIDDISTASSYLLPGVGAYSNAMQKLTELKLIQPLIDNVLVKKKPILGICLGMQILGLNSEEGDCLTITPNTYEVVDTGFGLKYCFNAGKFLLLNKESKNKIFSYNLKNFKKNYLHSFGEISEEQLNKMDEDFAQFSPHVVHYSDAGSLLVHLIYNHLQF